MKQDITRREILKKSSTVSLLVAGVSLSEGKEPEEPGTNQTPSSDGEKGQFRVINNTDTEGSVNVSLTDIETGNVSASFDLDTTGTNMSKVQSMAHKNRFPLVSADITSFGKLSRGKYQLKINYKDESDIANIQLTRGGHLPPDIFIRSSISPTGEIKTRSYYDCE
ncbi:hypothetical protein [Haladaptatus sp. W1]|uniref:hypothetical protein n=1 Tax=Haladaptatus sp. W1 TaxID=1897478 RepID=UPI001112CA8F|nr:hypothetical protein [Haladaptatus sp. W1]